MFFFCVNKNIFVFCTNNLFFSQLENFLFYFKKKVFFNKGSIVSKSEHANFFFTSKIFFFNTVRLLKKKCLFLKTEKKMYCDTDVCVNNALDGSWLCQQCLHHRFGPKIPNYALPDCLIREIMTFLPLLDNPLDVHSLDEFYFVYQYFAQPLVWHARFFSYVLTFEKGMTEILQFLATRFGKSREFWLKVKGKHIIETLLFFGKTDIVELFDVNFLNTLSQNNWIYMVGRSKTDESAWWLLNQVNLVFHTTSGKNGDVRTLFSSACHWKSERLCERLLKEGHVVESNSLLYCLEKLVQSNMPLQLFEMFWNDQESLLKSEFSAKHAGVLFQALEACNIDVLDFLAKLPNFAFGNCEKFAVSHLAKPVLRSWFKNRRLLHSGFWKHDKFYALRDDVMLELIVHTLESQPESECVTVIHQTPLLLSLVKNQKFQMLEHLVSRYNIEKFGDEHACCEILSLLCAQRSSLLAIHYWNHKLLLPCVTNVLLCDWLRKACFAKNWTLIPWLLDTFCMQIQSHAYIYDKQNLEAIATAHHFLHLVRERNYELAARLFRAAITFDVLRVIQRDFLVGRSLEVVMWFADLHDCNNEQMRIRDIRAWKNLMLRLATRRKEHAMLDWLWSFKDDRGCALKPGDLRDLRRG